MVEPVIVPADVRRLVIAARMVAYEAPATHEALVELEQAAEAFAARVPWDDEPSVAALSSAPVAPVGEGLREALEPVRHWYESDEHEPRADIEIVRDIVADLQHDRAENLSLRKDARATQPPGKV
jgi:hypothetical protein